MNTLGRLKRLLVGKALRTEQAIHERLSKKVALAVFSSDALSSTAYATEEILLVLATAYAFGQAGAFGYVIPISLAIATLLVIVSVSYRQTIYAYPNGGGAYIVAKENLGTVPGLVAGASLLVDYVLTVSVSIAAGVAAITSAAQGTQFAWITDHKVAMCLGFIVLIAVANLRGVRESGSLFALPTYIFLVSFLFMIGYGIVYYFLYDGVVPPPTAENVQLAEGYLPQGLTLFLLLGAFSNGCAALTGIEAISNGVMAFRKPESKNAAKTLIAMAILLCTMFLGTSVLAYLFGVHPHQDETVISQFARHIFTGGMGWFYFLVQASTAAILVLAANTAFADFPRLSSLLARDRFLPRQFANRGDKLVFSNGILILAVFSALLVIGFAGDTSRLIPLYAVGVFLSFTLSQAGMVRHWLRVRKFEDNDPAIHQSQVEGERSVPDPQLAIEQTKSPRFVSDETSRKHWKKSLVINLIGAVATAVVLTVFIVTKFMHGAWLVVVMIPILVFMFLAIHRHYMSVARQLSMETIHDTLPPIHHTVIVPISGIHRGVIKALQYAKSISSDNVSAVYVDIDEEATAKLREYWDKLDLGVKLVVLPSPYRELTRPLLRYIHKIDRKCEDDVLTIVLPEFVPKKWWQHLLHNQSSLLLKGALLFREGVIVTNVPYHLK